MWSQILLISVALFSGTMIVRQVSKRDLQLLTSSSVFGIAVIELIRFAEFTNQAQIIEFGTILILCALLTALLMTIRLLKPVYTRYPYPFVYLPFIIILGFPVVQDMRIISEIIFQLVQAGSLMVLLMLIIGYFEEFEKPWLAVFSVILFVVAYIIYWFGPSFFDVRIWMWQPLLALGMVSVTLIYPSILLQSRS